METQSRAKNQMKIELQDLQVFLKT